MKDTRQFGHLLFDLAFAALIGGLGAPWWCMVLVFLALRALTWLQRIFSLVNGLTTALIALHITPSLSAKECDGKAPSGVNVWTQTNGHDAS